LRNIGNVKKDGQVRSVASGALTDGTSVVVNTDGTVSVVSETVITKAAGTAVQFESDNDGETEIVQGGVVFDSGNNKIVIVYEDGANSSYGTAVVGTVDSSDNSISFGTPVVFESAATQSARASFITVSGSNRVVIVYKDVGNSSYGTAIVGTVSGTSISFGTATVFVSGSASAHITTDTTNTKVVLTYRDGADSNHLKAIVGTVSGTSISFGSANTLVDRTGGGFAIGFDSNAGKVVIAYTEPSNFGSHGECLIGGVSGTDTSFGSAVRFNSGSTTHQNVVFDSNSNKIVIAFCDNANSNKGTAVVGTVSDNSISFGSEAVFNDAITAFVGAAFDSNLNVIVVTYEDDGNSSHGTFTAGTVSGTSITFTGTETVYNAEATSANATAFDSNANKVVVAYANQQSPYEHLASVLQAGATITNLTSENFIGFSDGVFSDTDSAVINTANTIDRNQSGLTAGQTYFVQTDGTLGTTAADPSVTAGTAISTTELIVKG
jgi:hypothetical protein